VLYCVIMYILLTACLVAPKYIMPFPLPMSTQLTKAVQYYVQIYGTKFQPFRATKLVGKGKFHPRTGPEGPEGE
jgi:hypothetical protein